MKIGIMGSGAIAKLMAKTILGLNRSDINLYAIASRNIDKAKVFAFEFNISNAYGSYEQMAQDDNIDLIYIATPHSEHYANCKLCLKYNKAMLVEKAFCANYNQALEIITEAKNKNVFIAEAIWTRYMPSRHLIQDIIDQGKIGTVLSINANLCYPILHKERIIKPELAGGALLDLGVYPINFAMMFFGHKIKSINGSCIKNNLGVDLIDFIAIEFTNGKNASLYANASVSSDRMGYIYGTLGYIAVTNINNPEKIEVFSKDHVKLEEIKVPKQVSGYEYQILECKDSISRNLIECTSMTHQETLDVMSVMDTLRKIYSVSYPFEE